MTLPKGIEQERLKGKSHIQNKEQPKGQYMCTINGHEENPELHTPSLILSSITNDSSCTDSYPVAIWPPSPMSHVVVYCVVSINYVTFRSNPCIQSIFRNSPIKFGREAGTATGKTCIDTEGGFSRKQPNFPRHSYLPCTSLLFNTSEDLIPLC